jgi:PPOX class probable F420-dependent enzyme
MDEQVRRFLDERKVAHLATANASGAPHVVPICFATDGETLYVAIDQKPKRGDDVWKLRRLTNIAENPRVAVVADIYNDQDWSRLAFVLLRGTARVISGGDEHARAIAALRTRYAQYRGMALEGRPVIAVDIERVTAWGNLGY